jgi:hypothetical protein
MLNRIKLTSGVIIILTAILALLFGVGPEEADEVISGYITRVVLLLWGLFLFLSGYKDYKGGVLSALGAILIGVGVIALSRSLETGDFGKLQGQFGMIIATYLMVFSSGIAMLIYGVKNNLNHKVKDETNRNQSSG